MVRKFYLTLIVVAGTALYTGCDLAPSAPGVPHYLNAELAGTKYSAYEGSGTFRILPPGSSGARFSLVSAGTGAYESQGFSFLALEPLAIGEHPVGELDSHTVQAVYRYDDGDVRRIFEARSGSLQISDVTPRRVRGTFTILAFLSQTCTLHAAFPAPILDCTSTPGSEGVEITGSFVVGLLGGENPGLVPSS